MPACPLTGRMDPGLGPGGPGQDVPDLPTPKDMVVSSGQQDKGPVLPVPRGIRPTLAKYR